MSEKSYTLPRNFRDYAQIQAPRVPLGRRFSLASLNGVQNSIDEKHHFGSVSANIQSFPYQNVASLPMYYDPYQYTSPGRPMSVQANYSYQIPNPSFSLNPEIHRGRRNSAFYPVPSTDSSEYLYRHRPFVRTASLPPLSIRKLDSPLMRKNMSISGTSQTGNGSKNAKKVQLTNKIELEEITINKKSNDAFLGLIIEFLPGSLDQDISVVVQRLTFGGLCQKDGRIRRGDRILKVNGYRVKDFDTTIEFLREPNITLTVARATREFKRAHLRPISCSLFGYKPALKPSKAVTAFPQGPPRLVKGIDEAKLEVEMISLCRRLEKVRTGSKKVQWHIYNVDKQQYISHNKDKRTKRKHQKDAIKQPQDDHVKKQLSQAQHKIIDDPFENKQASRIMPKAAYHGNTPYSKPIPVFRTVPIMQPYSYWAPTVPATQLNPIMQMKQIPTTHSPYQNSGGLPRNRRSSVPYYFREGKENDSVKKSPIKQRSSCIFEETLL